MAHAPLLTRRAMLRAALMSAGSLAGSALLAACGDTVATPTLAPSPTATPQSAGAIRPAVIPAAPSPPPSLPPATAAMPSGMPTLAAGGPPTTMASSMPTPSPAARTTASKGTLTVALSQGFPTRLDVLKYANLCFYGMSEMLNRLTPQGKIEPWLAERVTNVTPTTWRVTLRPNVTFWDGTTLTADDVIAAFKKNWDANPDTNGLISKETKLTAVDAHTVEFVTPQPTGIFPGALTLPLFSIHKPSMAGATDGTMLTGPYKSTSFTVDNQLALEPHMGYWGGVPPIAKITVRNVADFNARVLALQSGDVNTLYGIPPEATANFGNEVELFSIPSGRVHYLVYNVNRAPFNDRAVREATTLALDRTPLNSVALDGKGTVATGMFPPDLGFDLVPLQGTDVNRAKQLLDEAGWKVGPDGVRGKDGKRLSFPILTFSGRPELTPLGVGVQGQLKRLGYDIPQVQTLDQASFREATKATANWDAAIYSNDTAPSGDPLYCFNRLVAKGGGNNLANYSNPQIERLLDTLRTEIDPQKRQAISRQVQEVVKADVPAAFLVIPPVIAAAKRGLLRGYMPHPSDAFFITARLSVA